MKSRRLSIDEEGENKSKSITLKVEDSKSDGDVSLIVNSFKIFLRHVKQQKDEQDKDEEKASFI